ncbi:MAG: insulinase family protein, partial [Helicobacter sp.]|nr:insulinase family protein [Helicobacter sp.]
TELKKAKTNMKASFLYELESSSSVASLYGSYLARGDLNSLLTFEENFEKLSTKDIIEVAKKYFIKENLTIVTMQR